MEFRLVPDCPPEHHFFRSEWESESWGAVTVYVDTGSATAVGREQRAFIDEILTHLDGLIEQASAEVASCLGGHADVPELIFREPSVWEIRLAECDAQGCQGLGVLVEYDDHEMSEVVPLDDSEEL